MKSSKKAKKTVLTIVTLSVVTSILITAAAAEEIDFNKPAPAEMPGPVAVIAAPAAISPEEIQIQIPTADSTGFDSSAGSDEPAPETQQDTSIAPVTTEPYLESGVYDTSPSKLLETVSADDLICAAGQTIADFTKQYDGFRYVYGAESPTYGFDCSGLVYYVYTHFGYTLPRTARAQYKDGINVEAQDLKPGDLVFFATAGGRSISHVGIYIGDNQFIHASTSRHGVMISGLDNSYWSKAYVAATRLVTPDSAIQQLYQPAFEQLL